MRHGVQVVFWAILAAVIAQAGWQYASLPERVATHFNAAGEPNGWMSRGAHVGFQIGLLLFIAALMQGLAWLNRRLPIELINVPNRDYWFAPERRDGSERWLRNLVLVLGCLVLGFFGFLFHRIYLANTTAGQRLVLPAWPVFGAWLAILAGVFAAVWRRFRRPAGG